MSTQTAVTSNAVPEDQRMAFLPRHFGRHLLRAEATVYSWAATLSVDYAHGSWTFFNLSNGGFFMAPVSPEKLRVRCDGNGFDGEMSAGAMGVVTTLFALCYLAEVLREDMFIEQYHALREFAYTHPEAGLIFRAID